MTKEQLAGIQQSVRFIITGASTVSLYSSGHFQAQRLVTAAYDNLASAFANLSEITLMVIDEQLVAGSSPLSKTFYTERFVQLLKARGIHFLKIQRDVTREELSSFVASLAKTANSMQELRDSANIRFGRVEVRYEGDGGSIQTMAELLDIADIPAAELAKFQEIYEEVRKHKKINIVGLSEIVAGFIRAFRQEADTLLTLAPLRAMDEYTFTHSTNVCILNLTQAMSLGIEGAQLSDIGVAALLHDIGKLFVPEEILMKKGSLTDEEFEIMKQHSVNGAQHLLDTPGVPRLAVVTAFEHHMKYDFSGYPQVPPGWRQNICSHMTAISDCFDALRTIRPYQGSVDYPEISVIMQKIAGTGLHPALTKNFLTLISKAEQK